MATLGRQKCWILIALLHNFMLSWINNSETGIHHGGEKDGIEDGAQV